MDVILSGFMEGQLQGCPEQVHEDPFANVRIKGTRSSSPQSQQGRYKTAKTVERHRI
jgi:hypothetical protein